MNVLQDLRNCQYGSPTSCHFQIIIYWRNLFIVSPVSPGNSSLNVDVFSNFRRPLRFSFRSSPSLWGLGASPRWLRPRRCSNPWRWSPRRHWERANTWPLTRSPQIELLVCLSYKKTLHLSVSCRRIGKILKNSPGFKAPMHSLSFLMSSSSMCSLVFRWFTALTETMAV